VCSYVAVSGRSRSELRNTDTRSVSCASCHMRRCDLRGQAKVDGSQEAAAAAGGRTSGRFERSDETQRETHSDAPMRLS